MKKVLTLIVALSALIPALAFAGLTLYPGTAEFELAREQGRVSIEEFFDDFSPRRMINMGEDSPGMQSLLEQLEAFKPHII